MSNKQQRDLNNKVSIITGASSGIGRSTAILFSELGSKLVLVGRNEKNLDETARLCSKDSSNNVLKVIGDVRDEGTRERIVNEALKKFNKIDILVNNAGGNIQTSKISPETAITEVQPSESRQATRKSHSPESKKRLAPIVLPRGRDSHPLGQVHLEGTKKTATGQNRLTRESHSPTKEEHNNLQESWKESSKPREKFEIELGLPLVRDPNSPDLRQANSQEQRETHLSGSTRHKSPESREVNPSAGNLQTLNMDDFDATMDLNVRAIILLTQKCLPEIIKQKGAIVNISSVASTQPIPNLLSYCMSKAALDQFTKCVALELANKGVRVNSVNPATIRTNIFKASGASEEKVNLIFEHAKSWHPIGRVGEPEEVAEAIAFLASDRASFSTGTCLNVDGGRLLSSPGWNLGSTNKQREN